MQEFTEGTRYTFAEARWHFVGVQTTMSMMSVFAQTGMCTMRVERGGAMYMNLIHYTERSNSNKLDMSYRRILSNWKPC